VKRLASEEASYIDVNVKDKFKNAGRDAGGTKSQLNVNGAGRGFSCL